PPTIVLPLMTLPRLLRPELGLAGGPGEKSRTGRRHQATYSNSSKGASDMPTLSGFVNVPGVVIDFDPGPEQWTISSGADVRSGSTAVVSNQNQSTLDNFGIIDTGGGASAVDFESGSSGGLIINEHSGVIYASIDGIRFNGNGGTIENFGIIQGFSGG